jgi:hypothetical protein
VFISHKLCKERIRKVCHNSGRNVFLVFINRGTKTVVLILTTRTLINLKKDPHQRHTTCSVTLEEIQQQCNRHKQVYTNDTGLQSVCIMSDKDVVVLTMANKLNFVAPEPEDSSPHSQQTATRPYPEPPKSIPHPLSQSPQDPS